MDRSCLLHREKVTQTQKAPLPPRKQRGAEERADNRAAARGRMGAYSRAGRQLRSLWETSHLHATSSNSGTALYYSTLSSRHGIRDPCCIGGLPGAPALQGGGTHSMQQRAPCQGLSGLMSTTFSQQHRLFQSQPKATPTAALLQISLDPQQQAAAMAMSPRHTATSTPPQQHLPASTSWHSMARGHSIRTHPRDSPVNPGVLATSATLPRSDPCTHATPGSTSSAMQPGLLGAIHRSQRRPCVHVSPMQPMRPMHSSPWGTHGGAMQSMQPPRSPCSSSTMHGGVMQSMQPARSPCGSTTTTHGGFMQLQKRHQQFMKDVRPATLDDVVRRHRNQGSVVRGFTVIEIYPNGACLDVNTLMSAADLGIPFRDATLFSSENTITDQKPTILVRQGSILFKSEAIRAVINENKAYIIKVASKSHRSYANLLEPLMETVKQDDAIPFELNVLEGLLYISCRWFDMRMKHIKSFMEGLMRDVNDGSEPFAAVYNEALIQQLAPLDKAITSLRNGSRDTCEAVQHLLENEDMLADICLTQQREEAREEAREAAAKAEAEELGAHPGSCTESDTPTTTTTTSSSRSAAHHLANMSNPYFDEEYQSDKEQARRMLESYDRELDAISGKLEEMRENLNTVRDSWSMKLDSARNHIILLNLKMTLASLCLMLATLFPSWGGMNINHGLPDEPWVFWTVVCFGSSAGFVAYPIASHLYRANWKIRSQRDLLRFHSLRAFLVEHLDDLDDVMDAMRKINHRMNRKEFEFYMKDQMPTSMWKRPSLDFLFSQYDLNKDGFLEGMEVAKKAAEEKGAEEAHMPDYLRRMGHLDELYEEKHRHGFFSGISRWLRSGLPWVDPDPEPLLPSLHQQQQQRGWISRVWFGKAPMVEERPGGRVVRH